jgi:hypothetical protein
MFIENFFQFLKQSFIIFFVLVFIFQPEFNNLRSDFERN